MYDTAQPQDYLNETVHAYHSGDTPLLAQNSKLISAQINATLPNDSTQPNISTE